MASRKNEPVRTGALPTELLPSENTESLVQLIELCKRMDVGFELKHFAGKNGGWTIRIGWSENSGGQKTQSFPDIQTVAEEGLKLLTKQQSETADLPDKPVRMNAIPSKLLSSMDLESLIKLVRLCQRGDNYLYFAYDPSRQGFIVRVGNSRTMLKVPDPTNENWECAFATLPMAAKTGLEFFRRLSNKDEKYPDTIDLEQLAK